MKTFCCLMITVLAAPVFAQTTIINTNIDMPGFLAIAREAALHRQNRRLTEAQFIQFSREPGTVILDARSRAMFDLLHVKGAVNLNFSDITVDSLAKKFPDKGQRILIYCNNNFMNSPRAFASKSPGASLNLSTFSTLFGYGYTNVYELGPLLDVKTTRIELVPAEVSKADRR
jgi:phage shock protein E